MSPPMVKHGGNRPRVAMSDRRPEEKPSPSPRRRFWTGVLVGLGITYGILVILGAAMYLFMDRCPVCGQVLENALRLPGAAE